MVTGRRRGIMGPMKDPEAPLVSMDRLKEVVLGILRVPKDAIERAEQRRLKRGSRRTRHAKAKG